MKLYNRMIPVLLLWISAIWAQPLVITQVTEGVKTEAAKQILIEAYRRVGVEVIFKSFPGERALIESNKGNITDGEMFRIDSMDVHYPNLVKVPTHYVIFENCAFTKSVDITVTGYESLRPYHIGFRIGLKTADFNTKGFERVTRSPDLKKLFQLMDLGRIDIIIDERYAGLEHVNNLGLEDIRILEGPIETVKLYHYLNKKHEALVTQLDSVFQEMHAEGTILKIVDEAVASYGK